jgi:hypothetical protein
MGIMKSLVARMDGKPLDYVAPISLTDEEQKKKSAGLKKGGTFKKGGEMKESKAMMKKEISFFKKKGAPKSMVKHEEAEAKGKAKGYAKGGSFRSETNGAASKGKTKAKQVRMNSGGSMKGC